MQVNAEFSDYLLYWLRWLGVIPLGFIAAFLSSIPVHIIVMNTFDSDFISLSESGLRVVEYAGYAFSFPVAFVWVGSWAAPAARAHVVALLAIFWVAAVVLVYIYFLAITNDESIEFDTARAAASIVLGLAGVIVGGKTAHEHWAEES